MVLPLQRDVSAHCEGLKGCPGKKNSGEFDSQKGFVQFKPLANVARIKELHEQSQFPVVLFGMAVCGVSTVTNLPVHDSLTVHMSHVFKKLLENLLLPR